MLKNPKNWWIWMKIANIDREIVHIFWTTWADSIKFSGKMYFKIILKVTKNQGFTLSLFRKYIFQKTTAGRGVKLTLLPTPPPPHHPAALGFKISSFPDSITILQKCTYFFRVGGWGVGVAADRRISKFACRGTQIFLKKCQRLQN